MILHEEGPDVTPPTDSEKPHALSRCAQARTSLVARDGCDPTCRGSRVAASTPDSGNARAPVRGGCASNGENRATTHRALHLLLIASILPAVILPGQTALCLCALVACVDCGSCCEISSEAPPPRDACCRNPACQAPRHEHSSIAAKSDCRGCVVLSPDKQVAPRTDVQGKDRPELAPVPSAVPGALPAIMSIACAPTPQPTSLSPPLVARSLPLVI
jgi:hypothetical protein